MHLLTIDTHSHEIWPSQNNTATPLIRPKFHHYYIIVNRGDWLWSPANIKATNKDAKIYVGRSTTLHNLLFYTHTLCMSYVTNTFLLVSSSAQSKQLLCFVQGQGQKSEQKHTTKNFVEFHNHSSLLTMCKCKSIPYHFLKLWKQLILQSFSALTLVNKCTVAFNKIS